MLEGNSGDNSRKGIDIDTMNTIYVNSTGAPTSNNLINNHRMETKAMNMN